MKKYLVGYIDEQAGEQIDFTNLMEEDEDFEVKIFPVDDETDFDTIMEEILHSDIHCLVVDYHLSEGGVQFEGSDIIQKLHQLRPYFPKIIYTAKEDRVIPKVDNEIIYLISDKSIKGDEIRGRNFRQRIKALIQNFRKKQDDINLELKALEEKRLAEGLNALEEDRYVELNKDLDKTIHDGVDLPRSFYSTDTNKKLDELIEKSEEILKKLSEEE